MNKSFYLKHSMMAMNDPRMKTLLKAEKLRGTGAYWFILEKLELLPEPRATLDYLKPFCCKEIPFRYLKKIILNFDLFEFDDEGYFMPVELNPIHKKAETVAKTAQNTIETGRKTMKTVQKTVENGQKSIGNEQKTVKISPKNDENEPDFAKKRAENFNTPICNKLIYRDLHQNTLDVYKENIKDIIITTEKERKKEKEGTAAAAVAVIFMSVEKLRCTRIKPRTLASGMTQLTARNDAAHRPKPRSPASTRCVISDA